MVVGLQRLKHVAELVVEDTPTPEYGRIPSRTVPGVSGIVQLSAGEAELIGIEMRVQLRYAVAGLRLELARQQGRALGVGLEEVVILQTLEHDEPIPVFRHEEDGIRDVIDLDTSECTR